MILFFIYLKEIQITTLVGNTIVIFFLLEKIQSLIVAFFESFNFLLKTNRDHREAEESLRGSATRNQIFSLLKLGIQCTAFFIL